MPLPHLSRLLPGLILALGLAGPASAEGAMPHKNLRVCKDPNNMPFANLKGEGFEDRIAELFGRKLGVEVEYFTFPQRLGFIRNTLRHKVPGQDYPCDIVLGVPAGWGQVDSTRPYYRSTYVMVFSPERSDLGAVQTEDDFLKLPQAKLDGLKIGIFDRSPGSAWVAHHGLVESGVPYKSMNPNPDEYPGQIVERDLADGKIDVAVVWGPVGAYFAKRVTTTELRVVPLVSEEGVRFDYAISMGVRRGEPEWKARVEQFLDESQAEIAAILDDYGVPTMALDEASGAPNGR
ncbi:MAG: quinoprotein dehydrogenase-associated putative ABC transporter substrate-binding protein [Rhodocyclaceae bacterium]|nr:quinoprotein dehydrogenase-associated putative ABC transporter substrate-binding protein [Rhodocyclaceae bacterium]